MRQVIERVVVEAEGKSERVGVRIEWAGGSLSTGVMIRPVLTFERLSYYPQLCERVSQLASEKLNSREIARRLDEEGYRSPKLVSGFGEQGVKEIVGRLGLNRPRGPRKGSTRLPESNEPLGEHEWWLGSLAREIRMPEPTLYGWVRRGWARARQLQDHPQHRWVVWADEAELERLRRLGELPTGYHTRRKWIEPEGDHERVLR